MAKGDTPQRRKLDEDAQDLVAQLGITPMDREEIAERYDRTVQNVLHRLIPRAREYGRQNSIVIDRPIWEDGFLYRARWDYNHSQDVNWSTMLNDLASRCKNMREDISSYTANARAEGKDDLAETLEDIHDLFKVTTRSVVKAKLLLIGGGGDEG